MKGPGARSLRVVVLAAVSSLVVTGVTASQAHAGENGQQVCVRAVETAQITEGTQLTIAGTNQNGEHGREYVDQLRYYGHQYSSSQRYLEACSWGWWWVGDATVILNNPSTGLWRAETHAMPTHSLLDVEWVYV